MSKAMKIDRLEQIRVMAHPLRMRLLEAFSQKPMTTKQVAQRLGEQPTKLYHHVDALDRVGLIELVRTHKKRGTLEKYYRTVARTFIVDRKLFQLIPQADTALRSMQGVFTSILEETLTGVYESIEERSAKPQTKEKRMILSHAHIQATPEQIQALEKKINRLLKKYEDAEKSKGTGEYGFTLVFYPVKKKSKKNARVAKRSKK